jgi:hypothetical protein
MVLNGSQRTGKAFQGPRYKRTIDLPKGKESKLSK